MVNKNYRRGRKFEYEIKNHLEEKGFLTFRTAGSHGIADIIGVSNNDVLLVQCKYGQKPTKSERMEMYSAEWNVTGNNIIVLLAYREPYKKIQWFEIDVNGNFIEIDFDRDILFW